MPRRRSIISRQRRVFAFLLLISFAMLAMPQFWTGGLMNFVQLLVPFQHGAGSAVDAVAAGLRSDQERPGSADDRERTALEHRIVALDTRVQELEKELEIVTATRLWEVDGARVGNRGRLVPARVVADDVLGWRSSRLATAGSLLGVQQGAAVVSNHFTIQHDAEAGIAPGMAILLGEALIGTVDRTATHTSRVQLLSDVGVQMRVRMGRLSGDRFALAEGFFWLVGRGADRMEIRDVDGRLVDRGEIAVGDLVVCDPAAVGLPTAMVIGSVSGITPDRTRPLFCSLTIRAALDVKGLRRVYIFDRGTGGVREATSAS